MNMLLHTVYPVQLAFMVFNYSPDIFIQLLLNPQRNTRMPVFSAENYLIEDLFIGAQTKFIGIG